MTTKRCEEIQLRCVVENPAVAREQILQQKSGQQGEAATLSHIVKLRQVVFFLSLKLEQTHIVQTTSLTSLSTIFSSSTASSSVRRFQKCLSTTSKAAEAVGTVAAAATTTQEASTETTAIQVRPKADPKTTAIDLDPISDNKQTAPTTGQLSSNNLPSRFKNTMQCTASGWVKTILKINHKTILPPHLR